MSGSGDKYNWRTLEPLKQGWDSVPTQESGRVLSVTISNGVHVHLISGNQIQDGGDQVLVEQFLRHFYPDTRRVDDIGRPDSWTTAAVSWQNTPYKILPGFTTILPLELTPPCWRSTARTSRTETRRPTSSTARCTPGTIHRTSAVSRPSRPSLGTPTKDPRPGKKSS